MGLGVKDTLWILKYLSKEKFVWSLPRFQAAIVKNDKSFDEKKILSKKFKGSILIYVY